MALMLQLVLPDGAVETDSVQPPRLAHASAVPPVTDYPWIVRKPIFAPDRMPDVNDVAEAAQDLSLVGVLLANSSATALIRDAEGVTRRVAVGESVDGWKLVAAETERATLERNGLRRILPITAGAAVPLTAADNDNAADTSDDAQSSDDDNP